MRRHEISAELQAVGYDIGGAEVVGAPGFIQVGKAVARLLLGRDDAYPLFGRLHGFIFDDDDGRRHVSVIKLALEEVIVDIHFPGIAFGGGEHFFTGRHFFRFFQDIRRRFGGFRRNCRSFNNLLGLLT